MLNKLEELKPKQVVKLGIVGVFALIILIVLLNGFYTVGESEFATLYEGGRAKEDIEIKSGLNWKIPFYQTVHTRSKKVKHHDVPATTATTIDMKNMIVDTKATWKITDPVVFGKALGNEGRAVSKIETVVYDAVETTVGRLDQDTVLKDRADDALDKAILELAVNDIPSDRWGVELIGVQVEQADPVKENMASIIERMVSEREEEAARYRAEGQEEAKKIETETERESRLIKSEALAEASRIRGEGESEYMRIINTMHDTPEKEEFYSFKLALETYMENIDDNTTIIFDKDSKLAKSLMQ